MPFLAYGWGRRDQLQRQLYLHLPPVVFAAAAAAAAIAHLLHYETGGNAKGQLVLRCFQAM